ncbi:hypothetical protein PIB30_009927 [Stylosanthes scabra]|uniref:Uncharacterized protein n=1 Tax=Stylosanthes scabra TaxID=79078 RepID=A0ABU6S5Q6_9FABA|nr:hypothetical protein [Stylosanthes scabra]
MPKKVRDNASKKAWGKENGRPNEHGPKKKGKEVPTSRYGSVCRFSDVVDVLFRKWHARKVRSIHHLCRELPTIVEEDMGSTDQQLLASLEDLKQNVPCITFGSCVRGSLWGTKLGYKNVAESDYSIPYTMCGGHMQRRIEAGWCGDRKPLMMGNGVHLNSFINVVVLAKYSSEGGHHHVSREREQSRELGDKGTAGGADDNDIVTRREDTGA